MKPRERKYRWRGTINIKQGRSRPVSLHHVRASVRGGDVVSFEHRMACAELDARFGLGDIVSTSLAEQNNDGIGQWAFLHSQKLPYQTGATALSLKQHLLAKPTATWRNVYSSQVGAVNVAYLMEIDVRSREPRMTRCTVAVDNGFCANPTGTASQLFGAAMDAFGVVFKVELSRMFDSPPETGTTRTGAGPPVWRRAGPGDSWTRSRVSG